MSADSGANFRWTPAMSVGVPALDSDHRCLMRIISLLHGIQNGEEAQTMIETALETLTLYGWFHFTREERVLEEIGYPHTAFHRKEHAEFCRYLKSLETCFGGRPQAELARDLFDELAAWVRHHILIQDMAFKPYVTDADHAETVARAGTAACLIDLGQPQWRSASAMPRPLEIPAVATAR